MAGARDLDDTGDGLRAIGIADPAKLRSRLIECILPAQLLKFVLTGSSDPLERPVHTVRSVDQIGEGDALQTSSGIVLGILVVRCLNDIFDLSVVNTCLLSAAAGAVGRAGGAHILQFTLFRLFIRRGMSRKLNSSRSGNGACRCRYLEKFSSGQFQFFIHTCTPPCKVETLLLPCSTQKSLFQ